MQSGSGRNPAGAPPGRSPSSSAASPSSSSSAVSAQNHIGFESIQQQHHQQLTYRQALQQQEQQHQLRKGEGDHALLSYHSAGAQGAMAGGTFPSSSGSMQMSQPQRKLCDLPGSSQQHHKEHSSKGQNLGPQQQNPLNQAHLQFALQAAQQKSQGNPLMHQHGKLNAVSSSGKDQEMHLNNLKMQELMSLLGENQPQGPIFKRAAEHFGHCEKQMDQGLINPDQRKEVNPPPAVVGQLTSSNMVRSAQMLPSKANMQNITSNQLAMAQMQAMHAWAKEHNIDLSVPANMNLISQFLPVLQLNRMTAVQKQNEVGMAMHQQHSGLPQSKQPVISPPVGSENASVANSSSDYSGQTSVKVRQTVPHVSVSGAGDTAMVESTTSHILQQSKEKNNDKVTRSLTTSNGQVMHLPQSSGNTNQNLEHSNTRNALNGNEMAQLQSFRPPQLQNRPMLQPTLPSINSPAHQVPSHVDGQQKLQLVGFTKQQLYVLKAQILAFRRLKRGERTLPPEVLQAIADPPVDSQLQQPFVRPGTVNQGPMTLNNPEEQKKHAENNDQNHQPVPSIKGQNLQKEEPFVGEEKAVMGPQVRSIAGSSKEPVCIGSNDKLNHNSSSVKSEQDLDRGNKDTSSKVGYSTDKGKTMPVSGAPVDAGQVKKPPLSNSMTPPKDGITRKYHGPIFDFPSFTRKYDSSGSTTANCSSNLTLAYDAKDMLFEEGKFVLNKKRAENLKKIGGLLAINLERKRIRPDIVMRLQIEERKLRLLDLQSRLRDVVDQHQQEIMAMADRPYRKFVRQCERQRVDLLRQVQQLQKASREKQLKSIFQWRKKLLEAHWAIRDARTTRNRGIAKYHERMLREFSKKKDDDRNKRMEALKNNDVDRYREMLLEQQTNIPGDAAERYAVLSSFLTQTEEYLHKLGGKISTAKSLQDVQEAANHAAAAARAQGLSEEEVKAAAACAREEVMIRNRFSEMNAPKDSSSVNKYYSLAHAVTEKIARQPSMLRAGTLRDYQLVGLQWMLSLYNNKLNGILADEMGLGKTVQVMALLAYLMEFKGNYGPHLIIVPNAVLVNWKSELLNWLPSVSCIFYVGAKEQRSKLFSQEVCAVKFNVLVTTYEFIMYDRSKLSKIDWRYIIIDEAQRMKDRESVLARDLDRYRCQRRLLLTGTPLQNDLKELWSLLNLLLPEVFDNRKAFNDWFSKPFQRDGPSHNTEEDDWLETEKKVIVIHRLHQILEPFMLRRRVEDVEGSLPRKVSIVLRCRMSAFQGAIYDWIKSTGTIRVDPEDEMLRLQKNPMYQTKMFKNLNNKCMELRKVCNHPLLNYPYFGECSKDFIVRSCGKLWVLDRILIKLQKAGHRVLLFSTMTKLLDILEEYLQWRRLVYRRIDGTTSLEDRESAIVDFNCPDSDCFIFLLSIRAAGRGLNLQTADTVVIYDPDPNPQNEEQAVARAHRIGQRREVKVIYMEAVVDNISSYQKEDELRTGGAVDSDDDLAGKDRYMGSIESLIRNNIQQYKIDMADEVINAGRFDQRTTHEERRLTLETLLHDDERYQETVHDVPSMQEVNRMIARSEEEVELFDQMDEDLDWTSEMVKYDEVPKWLRASSREVDAVVASLSKKPSKNILFANIQLEPNELFSSASPSKSERRRRRPKSNKYPIYRELDDDDIDDLDVVSEERNGYEEEEEIGEFEDEEFSGAVDVLPNNKGQLDEGLVLDDGTYEYLQGSRDVHAFEEAGSTGSSSGCRRPQPSTPMSLQKFCSLSALDARPDPPIKQVLQPDELEEGEIAASADSHMDNHQSGSWTHEQEEGEEEQVLQPRIKRKRSIRLRPRLTAEKLDERSSSSRMFSQHGQSLQVNHEYDVQLRADQLEASGETGSGRHDKNGVLMKQKRNLPSRKESPDVVQKSGKLSYLSGSAEDTNEPSRESWNSKATSSGGPNFLATKMSDSTQRKCKNVISKLQKRIHKEGSQILPILSDWWGKNEYSGFPSPGDRGINVLDLQRIEQRVDSSEYNGVTDFIADVQMMLRNIVRYFKNSYEIMNEAGKIQDMFFGIMKIAFPDSDFREARNAVTFSSLEGPPTAPSPKSASTIQSKRHIPIHKVEADSGPSKHFSCGMASTDGERTMTTYGSRLQKESRSTGGTGKEQARECSQLAAHPAELVICKKKRKDREKSVIKQRMAPVSPSNPGRLSSVSPSSQGILGSTPAPNMNKGTRTSFQKDSHPVQQPSRRLSWVHSEMQSSDGRGGGTPSIGDIQWAKPVKRTRTDSGKRRPSHL